MDHEKSFLPSIDGNLYKEMEITTHSRSDVGGAATLRARFEESSANSPDVGDECWIRFDTEWRGDQVIRKFDGRELQLPAS